MNLKLAFRCLLVLEIALSVVVLPVTVALSSSLPRDLTRYLENLPATSLEGPLAWLLPAFELLALLGLFFFVRAARELYLVMIGGSLAQTMFDGMPVVLPVAIYVTVQVERMVAGLIVGLAYGSSIASLLSVRRPSTGDEGTPNTTSAATPSNNEMQRTRPPQAMEPRR